MRYTLKFVAAAAVLCAAGGAFAQKGETVKIAFMDPLSGPFANVGQNQLKSWQFAAERLSGRTRRRQVRGGRLRQQGSPQESLNTLTAATRASATSPKATAPARLGNPDAINKVQRAQSGQGTGLPELRGGGSRDDQRRKRDAPSCSFWHFRLDADTS
jgi:branched-chain amino acid transport system substrate-binding protein